MSKKNMYPLLLLGSYIIVLCTCLTYISFEALGAEDIVIKAFKHLII